MNVAVSRFIRRYWFSIGVIGLVLLLYASSIHFGLIWDDPRWYAQGEGLTPWQLFTSLDTYQFYRPATIWLVRQMVAPNGIVAAQTAHLIQIFAHMLAALAAVPMLRVFKFERHHARMAALIFALYPLSYQAVAWQAPQQPITMLAVFIAILLAARFKQRNRSRYLVASLATYAFALLFQESALPFVVMFFWLAFFNEPINCSAWQRRTFWPLLHLTLAVIFFVIWLSMPRESGVTGRGLDARVLAYGLQGVVFPIAALMSSQLGSVPVPTLIALYAAIWLVLTLGAWAWQGKRPPMLSTLWLIAGLLPIVIGLSWSYTRIGARLLYPASLGIAMLWGSWLAHLFVPNQVRRAIGLVVAIGVTAVSLAHWWSLQQLYQLGTHHLDQTIEVLAQQPDQSVLLINYPDRLWLRPALYPLGEWGLILAPVVLDMSDFAVSRTGRSAETRSLSAFRVGASQRGAYPYEVFMRGEDMPPEKLAEAAAQVDRVLITEYAPDGELVLHEAGSIHPASSPTYHAQFAAAAQLIDTRIDGTVIDLVWRALSPLCADDTIFVHLWRDDAFVAAFDGDSVGGLIPPANWPLGADIVDRRSIGRRDLPPGQYEVRVGLYNRSTAARYAAFDAQGNRLKDDAVAIGVMEVR
ncbi:hypothetical protein TFLX_01069 [Thermoflexales bacterium]|nr:hypothetical protein TFLX_01069 [Thermoflexales bacterium]